MWGHPEVEAALACAVSEDQLQRNDKGMWLSSDYYMELWTLIRTNQFESRMSGLFYLKAQTYLYSSGVSISINNVEK